MFWDAFILGYFVASQMINTFILIKILVKVTKEG